MPIRKIGEVIVYVENMDAQVAFYRDKLGLQVTYPQDKQDYSAEFWVTLDTGACVLALHGGGQRRFGADAPKFVFDVPDIRHAWQELREAGVSLDEIFEAAPGVLVANGVDPEGNKFSIEQNQHRPV